LTFDYNEDEMMLTSIADIKNAPLVMSGYKYKCGLEKRAVLRVVADTRSRER